MTPESMIFDVYGIRVRRVPRDGSLRRFKIDDMHNGFVLAVDDCAVFGSVIHADRWIVGSGCFRHYKAEHKDNKEIRFEWMIWEGARTTFERGERLSRVDRERLELAVQRLEKWL